MKRTCGFFCVVMLASIQLAAADGLTDQATEVSAIEKLGGKVVYDETAPGKPVVKVDLTRTKVTDADLAGLKAFPQVRFLNLTATRVGDAGMANLKGLQHLSFIDARGTQVTDAAFVYFKELPEINRLGLEGAKITNAHLKDLHDLPTLRTLIVDHTQITDAGIPELASLTQLDYLNLGAVPSLTADGIKQLKGMTTLKMLSLSQNAMGKNHVSPGDDTLEALAGLTQLTSLDIRLWNITDAGLATVEKMPHLQTLIIWQTPVTDEGLKHLWGLSELTILDIRSTKCTGAGITELQKHLPKCRIIH